MSTMVKRDTHAIWFKHLPGQLSRQFESLEPDQTVDLIVNGQTTTWARMKQSPNGPMRGQRMSDNCWPYAPA